MKRDAAGFNALDADAIRKKTGCRSHYSSHQDVINASSNRLDGVPSKT